MLGVPQAQEKVLPLDKSSIPFPIIALSNRAPARRQNIFRRGRQTVARVAHRRVDQARRGFVPTSAVLPDTRMCVEEGERHLDRLDGAGARSRQQHDPRPREIYGGAERSAQACRVAGTQKYLEAVINNDDFNQSDALMRQSSTNFWGGIANRLLGSVDLVGVASGNYERDHL